MSESDSDVTLCSQEDVVRQSQRFESQNTQQTENMDHAFLIKVRDEIWQHMHKVKFMHKRKATHYLMRLSQFQSSQESECLSVARSIGFLKKIIADLEDLEKKLSMQSSQVMEQPAGLLSQFSVGSDIAALENINNPVQYDNLASKLPADVSVNFTSTLTSTFPDSMLTNKNFISQNDSGISFVESEFSGQAAKRSKTSFGAVKKYSNTAEELKRKHDFPMLETPASTSEDTQVEMTNIENNNNPNSDEPATTNEDSDEDEFGNIENLTKIKDNLQDMIKRFQVLFTKEVEEYEKVKMRELEAEKKNKKTINKFLTPYEEPEQDDMNKDTDDDRPASDLKGLALYYQKEYSRLFPGGADQ